MDEAHQEVRAKWIQCIFSFLTSSRDSDCTREQFCLREHAVFFDLTDFPLEADGETQLTPTLETRHAAQIIPDGLRYVGGLDISYYQQNENRAIAVLAVLHFPSMEVAHMSEKEVLLDQPYIPSFLAFREADHLLDLVEHCPEPRPQVLFVDGNGRLHEREAGLGVAIGVHSNLPTVAVAKNYQPVAHDIVGDDRFDVHGMAALCRSSLKHQGDWLALPDASCQRTLGAALLTSPHPDSVRPVFVSAGHRLSLGSCIGLTLTCCTQARVPDPIRVADHHGREILRKSTML